MRWTWRRTVACIIAVLFVAGMVLLCGWRWGSIPGRWAYLGVALSIFSALGATALAVAKADQVSEAE